MLKILLEVAPCATREQRLLFDGVAEFARGCDVADGVGDEIDGRDDERNHAPGSEEQAFTLELPVFLAEAGFAHGALELEGLAGNEHTDVAMKGNLAGLAHAAADLAAADGMAIVDVGGRIDAAHGGLLAGAFPSQVDLNADFEKREAYIQLINGDCQREIGLNYPMMYHRLAMLECGKANHRLSTRGLAVLETGGQFVQNEREWWATKDSNL